MDGRQLRPIDEPLTVVGLRLVGGSRRECLVRRASGGAAEWVGCERVKEADVLSYYKSLVPSTRPRTAAALLDRLAAIDDLQMEALTRSLLTSSAGLALPASRRAQLLEQMKELKEEFDPTVDTEYAAHVAQLRKLAAVDRLVAERAAQARDLRAVAQSASRRTGGAAFRVENRVDLERPEAFEFTDEYHATSGVDVAELARAEGCACEDGCASARCACASSANGSANGGANSANGGANRANVSANGGASSANGGANSANGGANSANGGANSANGSANSANGGANSADGGGDCGATGYYVRGKLRADVAVVRECCARCRCARANCANSVVRRGCPYPLALFRTFNGCGWGVRTEAAIAEGSYVLTYAGEVIGAAEKRRRASPYVFAPDEDQTRGAASLFVDARDKGNLSRFVNHSCEPNLRVVKVFADVVDRRLPQIAFFAGRTIAPGEELCINYGDAYKLAQCKCGRRRCSGAQGGDE